MKGNLHPVRIDSLKDLSRYCYQVAGSVGEMMSPLLNVTSPEATQFAIDLGLGMQITNICRDVLEDAERGRVYLPATWLHEYELTSGSILQQNVGTAEIAPIINRMLATAEVCYRLTLAVDTSHFVPDRILIARRVYRAIYCFQSNIKATHCTDVPC